MPAVMVWGVVDADLRDQNLACWKLEMRAVMVWGVVDADLRDQSLAAGS